METTNRRRGLIGPSIQIDPLFPYYENRSPASIAEEIWNAGYSIVRYFVVSEKKIKGELIEAFRDRGMFVWALVLGNGTFSTEGYPDEWTEWQMGLLKPVNDGYKRFTYFSEPYVHWKKQAISRLLTEYRFDGIEIAEPYFPEWDGINRGVYGDVGPLAREAFVRQYGFEMPEFVDRRSPRYYKKIKDIYAKWVRFRVEAVNGFLNEMINGEGGARSVRPDIAVATWSLAIDAGKDSAERLRELQGLDAPSMIGSVRPDMHMLQTHWPDWTKASLPADYAKAYEPFVRAIRHAYPSLPLGVQADIGSARHMIKGREWLHGFHSAAKRLGYSTWTAYEYHIGGPMYETPPLPVRAARIGAKEVKLSFNKRIDPESCRSLKDRFSLCDRSGCRPIPIDEFGVDGNRLYVSSGHFPSGAFELRLPGIQDTPALWLISGRKANKVPDGTRIAVPAWTG